MRRTTLVAAAVILMAGGGWVAGQQEQVQYGRPEVPQDIRTGADLGFRVREMKDGRVLGTLVVRDKNGQWVEAVAGSSRGFVVPLESK